MKPEHRAQRPCRVQDPSVTFEELAHGQVVQAIGAIEDNLACRLQRGRHVSFVSAGCGQGAHWTDIALAKSFRVTRKG